MVLYLEEEDKENKSRYNICATTKQIFSLLRFFFSSIDVSMFKSCAFITATYGAWYTRYE